MVRTEFFTAPIGTSSLAEIQADTTDSAGVGRAKVQSTSTTTVNAVRIRGFWRENPDSQNVVSKLLKNLKEKPGSFTFTVPGPDGKPLLLKDEQILKVTLTSADKGEVAFPFEITLPLAREVRFK